MIADDVSKKGRKPLIYCQSLSPIPYQSNWGNQKRSENTPVLLIKAKKLYNYRLYKLESLQQLRSLIE